LNSIWGIVEVGVEFASDYLANIAAYWGLHGLGKMRWAKRYIKRSIFERDFLQLAYKLRVNRPGFIVLANVKWPNCQRLDLNVGI